MLEINIKLEATLKAETCKVTVREINDKEIKFKLRMKKHNKTIHGKRDSLL